MLFAAAGPWYFEHSETTLLIEPWNSISSLAFWIPAIYWIYRLRNEPKKYAFILSCMPLLFMGGLGSALFHGFRSPEWFLLMDVLPIALLVLAITGFLWKLVLIRWVPTILVVLSFTGLRFGVFALIPGNLAVNISYFISGVMIFLPAIYWLIQNKWKGAQYFLLAVVFMGISLFFRTYDFYFGENYLPMGSHFLWHLFSGMGALPLGAFLKTIIDVESLNKTELTIEKSYLKEQIS